MNCKMNLNRAMDKEITCRLCLHNCLDIWSIFSEDGIEKDMASIIRKHIYLEVKEGDPVSTYICYTCWEKLKDFHVFFLSIGKAQSKLSDLGIVTKSQNETEDGLLEVPENDSDDGDDLNKDSGDVEILAGTDSDLGLDDTLDCEKVEPETALEDFFFNKKPVRRRGRPPKRKQNDDLYIKMRASEQLVIEEKKRAYDENLKKSKEQDDKIANFMKLKCEICHIECPIFSDIIRHFREVHKRRGYVICCNKKLFKRVFLVDHINKHLNPEYFKCDECKKTFSDKHCLKNHMRQHESEEAKIYKCEECPKQYSTQGTLNRHKLLHIPVEQRKFVCDECNKAFPTESFLRLHKRNIHENAYAKMCHICAKVIRGKTEFQKHQMMHSGYVEPPVQCKDCGLWLKNRRGLRRHRTRHTDTQAEHICSVCGKISPSKEALQSHIRFVHRARRTFQCSVCDKAFKKGISLKEHMATHTGETLYTCPHCPKTFNSSANMHSHRKKAHRSEWEENQRKQLNNKIIPDSSSKIVDT